LGRNSAQSNQLAVTYAMTAQVIDSDGDGLTDAEEDTNLNGRQDANETNAKAKDSDGDGWSDGYERKVAGTDPLDRDSDRDGVVDSLDTCHDVDGDGLGSPTIPTSTCPADNCVKDFNPTQLDSDHDGKGEVCDPCTNVDGQQMLVNKRYLKLNRINFDPARNNDQLSLKGDLTLPESSDFALLVPGAHGSRLVVTAANGATRVDETIPAGMHPGGRNARGWKYVNRQKAWKYTDATDNKINGISKIMIKDRSRRSPRSLRVSLKARGGNYPVTAGDIPVNATLVFGDLEASVLGECGESDFNRDQCQFNRSRRKLSCSAK
jgi:hypothetical protein